MDTAADWQLTSVAPEANNRYQNHIQAWARDTLTGEPVYIMELGEQRRGAKCGCECQSCDLPLTAVNAARSEYIKRPHFRHPNGAEKSECMFLAARLAALQLLREQGLLVLPARRILGKVMGLSGTQHEVWIEHPAERLRIRDFDFQDKAAAMITLEDGRQLRFQLIGSVSRSEDGLAIPTVFLDLKDSELAGLSPEELRKRSTLVPDGLCWLSHWKDPELQLQADAAALAKAIDLIDIEGEFHGELAEVEQKFRRETLLHLEVKKILSEVRQIRVPGIQCRVCRIDADGFDVERSFDFPSLMIPLVEVALEKRFGGSIPDVTVQTAEEHGGLLLIEVTVTNAIHQQRLMQIQDRHVPALEIDLSRTGGLISRSELRDLVVESVEFKRWLCHPKADLCIQELEATVSAQLQERNRAIQAREAARQLILETPIENIANDYLDAIRRYQTHARNGGVTDFDEISELIQKISMHAAQLAVHGFDEAKDQDLFDTRSQIIPRILSIKNGGGVGYAFDSTMSVMNAIKQSQINNRKYHTVFLIAEAVYRNSDAPSPPTWYLDWVDEIKKSIESGSKMYVRPRRYDQLLSLLFPEMRARLKKPFGTESFEPKQKHKPISQIRNQSMPDENSLPFWPWNLKDASRSEWLKGHELDQWKRTNPDAARAFFSSKDREEGKE